MRLARRVPVLPVVRHLLLDRSRVRLGKLRRGMDAVHPALLAERDVLDQAGDGDRTRGRRRVRLLVGEAEGGVADAGVLLGEEVAQRTVLVGDRRGVAWHGNSFGRWRDDEIMTGNAVRSCPQSAWSRRPASCPRKRLDRVEAG